MSSHGLSRVRRSDGGGLPLRQPDAAQHEHEGRGVEHAEWLVQKSDGEQSREHRDEIDVDARATGPDQIDAAQEEQLRQA
jgi:hypothetical protein